MSINIRAKQDYSALFAGLYSGNGKTSANMLGINLSDYASIKSGSYGKLMKAYYAKNSSDDIKNVVEASNKNKYKTASDDQIDTIAKLEKSATEVSSQMGKLTASDQNSLFAEKEITIKNSDGTESKTVGVDKEAIKSAVNGFVEKYNKLLAESATSTNQRVQSARTGITNLTDNNKQKLEAIGITIGSDKKLTVDQERLSKADASQIKAVFQGNYGSGVTNRADLIEMYAKNDAAKASGLYGSNAAYTSVYNTGNLYNGFF